MVAAKTDVLIVGGGMTGLAAAYIAARAGKSVRLIEASDSCGGLLKTFTVGGSQLEHFYHHFFTHDAEIHWLLNELNLQDEIVYKESTMGIYSGDSIYAFNSILDLFKFRPIKWIDKIKFGLSSLFLSKWASWSRFENTTSTAWLKRWSGQSTYKNLWEPMLRIKFGPYKDSVPVSWMIGRMRQRVNSRKAGKEKLGYLNGSLQVLCDALVEKLKEMGVEILVNEPMKHALMQDQKLIGVQGADGNHLAEQVLFTLPGPILSSLWQESGLKKDLGAVQYFGVYCAILELTKPLSDVYWLNIAKEECSFGGVIEHTNFISPSVYNNKHIVYLSRYFAYEEAIAQWPKEHVQKVMEKDLMSLFPDLKPSQIEKFHLFRANNAAPVVDLNYTKKVVPHALPIEGGFVANMTHLYPDERGVNNSIRLAAVALKEMGIDTHFVPKNNSLVGEVVFHTKTEAQ